MVERLAKPLLRVLHSRPFHPVIIKAKPGALREAWAQVRQLDLSRHVTRHFFQLETLQLGYWGIIPSFGMVSAILGRRDIEDLAQSPYVEKIYLDYPVEIKQLFPTVPPDGVYQYGNEVFTTTKYTKLIIGATDANKRGITGDGVKVGVVDTGAAVYHEMLGLRYKETSFQTVMPFQRVDDNGHGSWCCATIGGRKGVDDRLSRKIGVLVEAEGIAPDVDLVCVKALGYVIGTGMTSQIIKGMEIAADRGSNIISMSLGGPCQAPSPEEDPFYPVTKQLTEQGVILSVAAGNEGPGAGTVASPGCMPDVLTVAAYDPIAGKVADFSSRGPTPWGDVKPDVAAPGVNILSASVGLLDAIDHVVDRYGILSGTSMATPHVSGLLALMMQAHRQALGRDLATEEVKRMMEEWANTHGIIKSNDYGWGPITWDIYVWWLSTQYGINI